MIINETPAKQTMTHVKWAYTQLYTKRWKIFNKVVFYDLYFPLFPHPPTRIVYLNFDCEPILPENEGNSLLALAIRTSAS